ncbi:hypothetical protein LTR78_004850 [Recurvomyces mirabilis]|uniref:Protein kinase domain-containing protein n=1 Tax=Recurvomyces mirabilis TaxID=574656 RepID=A0AAE0WPF4_9PEZI|nr:hypothetical protein LTR78_004850 [Recurvomyces mirabilis]KAK5158021.1 hypothetical protein LTS14_003944 [Recurvomyces mirabilis]
MSSGTPKNTWPILIVKHKQRLEACEQKAIADEDDFRATLSEFWKKYRERDGLRLLNRIRKQHNSILELAAAVDAALGIKAPDSLTALVFSVATAAVQAAFESKAELAALTQETKRLNDIVPSFNVENLRRFQTESRVRQPLEKLFESYMESYMAIFSESAPLVLCIERFRESLTGKDDFFAAQRADWERAFRGAQEEEQLRIDQAGKTAHAGVPEPMVLQRTNAQFDSVRELGAGQFGRVHCVKQYSTGEFFAQKFIPAPKEAGGRSATKKRVLNEVDVMKKLQHHHIASMLFYTEHDAGFNLIMLPVGDCNLREFLLLRCINADYPRSEIQLLDNWFGCLITALAFAHSNKIKHEDIKPSNILIKGTRVYLADFGCAWDFEESSTSLSADQSIAGTPVYWPPEPLKERGRAADVFALGCVFSEMLTVRQGCTLDEYGAARRVDERDNPYAFSKNLVAVEAWLRNLPGMEDGATRADVPKLLLKIILKMLERDNGLRENARQLKRELKVEDEVLFCSSCW